MSHQLQQSPAKKTTLIVVVVIVLVLGLAWAGWEIYGRFKHGPPTTDQVRRSIWKFLAQQTKGKPFKPPLDLAAASVAGPASVVTVTTTNKAGKVRTVTPASKTAKLALPETTLSTYFRTNQAEAGSYPEMFRLVGEQLTVTEVLLAKTNESQRLLGMVMASEASTYARTNAMSAWLGARICEAYLWPNLALVENTNRSPLTVDAVLNLCDLAFKEAGETNYMVRNYEMLIAKGSDATRADAARFRLSIICEELGDDARALKLLKEIKNIKTAHITRKIAALEAKLATRKP